MSCGIVDINAKKSYDQFCRVDEKRHFFEFHTKNSNKLILVGKTCSQENVFKEKSGNLRNLTLFLLWRKFFFYQTWRSSPVDFRHCGPNKGTLKFGDIRSKKGIFSLFAWFPYLTNFSNNVLKSQKLLPEIEHSDLNY